MTLFVAMALVVAMVLIFDRPLFVVSWLFGHVMSHLQKMLHAMMCASTHVWFDWPQLHFLHLMFSLAAVDIGPFQATNC